MLIRTICAAAAVTLAIVGTILGVALYGFVVSLFTTDVRPSRVRLL